MTVQPSQPTTLLTATQRRALEALAPLSEEERLDARDRARRAVLRKIGPQPSREQFNSAGPRPLREQFDDSTISEYPAWMTRAISAMLVIAFLGAFATSAFSVFSAGRDHYLAAMGHGAGIEWQAVIVGLAIVLLAEFLTIASVLAARILLAGRRLWQLVMLLPIAAGVVMAITANAVIARPVGFWPWLVTVAPPVSVVFLSLILEQIALTDIKRRHANERAFQAALREWKLQAQVDEQAFQAAMREWEQRVAHPEQSPHWMQAYANSLKEALREANSRGRGRAERLEYMASLGGPEWSALVTRELRADRWFEEVAVEPNFTSAGATPQSFPAILPERQTTPPEPTLIPALPLALKGNGSH